MNDSKFAIIMLLCLAVYILIIFAIQHNAVQDVHNDMKQTIQRMHKTLDEQHTIIAQNSKLIADSVNRSVILHTPPTKSDLWIKQRLLKVKDENKQFCEDFFYKRLSNGQAYQDLFLFENYLSILEEPGVYLDIGANEAKYLSNTYFFDVCLGWKGVVVEPNPLYKDDWKKFRTARLLTNCVHHEDGKTSYMDFYLGHSAGLRAQGGSKVTCRSLDKILEENKDILGDKDESGKYGSKINFISLDIEGFEPQLIGCTDIGGIFSRAPAVQVWTIETVHFRNHGMNIVDASFLLAGYIKTSPILQSDKTFLDDVYVQQNTKKFTTLPQHICKDGSTTCRLADRFIPSSFPFNC